MAPFHCLFLFLIFSARVFIESASPIVLNPIPDQVAFISEPFVYHIPNNTFIDPDGKFLRYNATLSNGNFLPECLFFDFVPALSFLGRYNTPGFAQAVTVSHNIAYVADWGGGLQIINVTIPAHPTLLGYYYTTIFNGQGITVVDDIAYVATFGNGLQIIDVNDPSNPVYLGYFETQDSSWSVTVDNGIAYLSVATILQIIDVTDPSNPTLIGSYDTLTPVWGVTVDNDIAYVANWDSGLLIINVTDPSNPTFISNYVTPGYAMGIAVVDDIAYIANHYHGLQIIDVSNSSNPTFMSSFDTPDMTRDVTVDDDIAYVTVSTKGVQIINVTDPSIPALIGSFDTEGDAYRIAIDNDIAYIADFSYGLQITTLASTASIQVISSPNPIEYFDISITAIDINNEFAVDTFRLTFLNFTSTNSSSIECPDTYLFDLLQYPAIGTIEFFLTNASLVPNFNISISEIQFIGSNEYFVANYSQLPNNDFIISVFIQYPVEGTFHTNLIISCNSPYDTTCANIPISINILGPIASPNTTSITFPPFSQNDIIDRPLYDDSLCQQFTLSPNHNYKYLSNPHFILNATYDITGDSSYFSVKEVIITDNVNHFVVCLISGIPQSVVTANITLTCNYDSESDCGIVVLYASVLSPLVENSDPQFIAIFLPSFFGAIIVLLIFAYVIWRYSKYQKHKLLQVSATETIRDSHTVEMDQFSK